MKTPKPKKLVFPLIGDNKLEVTIQRLVTWTEFQAMQKAFELCQYAFIIPGDIIPPGNDLPPPPSTEPEPQELINLREAIHQGHRS